MSGYVRLYRSLFGHPAFKDESQAMAFAWMIGKASWRDTRVRYKGHAIDLKRGQLAISVRDFAEAHDRNKNWVTRLLDRLRGEDMIKTDAGTGVLVITICNYDEFQGGEDDGETPKGTARGTRKGTRAGQRRDTEQRREEGKNISSEANASGAEPSPDPVKQIFDIGVDVLTEAGIPERQARSLVGKWRKAKSDGEVVTALLDCRARSISDPVEWLEKRFKPVQYVSASGYEYRGSVDDVIRESERRADWNTYWGAVRDKRLAEEARSAA